MLDYGVNGQGRITQFESGYRNPNKATLEKIAAALDCNPETLMDVTGKNASELMQIGEFLKGLHLTEGRNTGFKKILDALAQNGSPLPEFETDEAHDYFITRLFVRKGFYSYENVAENVVENVADIFTPSAKRVLENYSKKRRKTAELLLEAIASDSNITITEMAAKAGATTRTVQRYLQEFQNTGILLREGSDAAGKWILV